MEHPLIPDLTNLKEDEVVEKINELRSKLAIAARFGNQHLCNQVRMAIESYEARYRVLMQEQIDRANQQIDNFANKIDIKK
jgi:hypothetical protein